jgi:hypothetical protein
MKHDQLQAPIAANPFTRLLGAQFAQVLAVAPSVQTRMHRGT